MAMLIYNTYNPYTISSQTAQQSNISQLLQATPKIVLILMCLIMQYNNFQILTTDKVQMLHFKFLKFKLIQIHKIKKFLFSGSFCTYRLLIVDYNFN